MKFTSVALVAAFLCVAVSAAPLDSYDDFDEVKADFMKVKCGELVVEKALKGTEFEKAYKELKVKVDGQLADVEKCLKSTNKGEAVKCATPILKTIRQESDDFKKVVADKNKALADKIYQQINSECGADPEFSADDTIKEIKKYFARIECAEPIAVKALAGTEFEKDFKTVQAKLNGFMEKLAGCLEKTNKDDAVKCAMPFVKSIKQEIESFKKVVMTKNKDLADKLLKQVNTQCGSVSAYDAVADIKTFWTRVKCAEPIVEKGLTGTEFEKDFKEIKVKIDGFLGKIEACLKGDDAVKCASPFVKTIREAIETYKKVVVSKNKALAEKIQKDVNSKCGAESAISELVEYAEAALELADSDIDLFELFGDDWDKNLPPQLRYIKCLTRAVDKATRGTKYQPIFDAHRNAMWAMEDKLVACVKAIKSKNDLRKAAACIITELKTGLKTLIPFFRDLAKMHKELPSQPALNKKVEAEKAKCKSILP